MTDKKIINEPKQLDVSELTEAAPSMIASQLVIAKVLKAKLDALVEEGFTHQDALSIIRARGINP